MKVSDPIKRAVPFCLCLCILCCLLPAIAAISGSTASIKLCILSDLHYLAAADQAAADGNEWRLYGESAPATEEAIEAVIRQRPDVLLLTGDLTSGAGRASAEELAQKLQKVEQAGIRVFVINGESDMSGGLSPAEFRDIFHAYGYDGADSAAYYQPQPSEEAVQGSLSYAVTPKPGIRLLMIDSEAHEQGVEGGAISDGLMKWVLQQADRARQNGETLIAGIHRPLLAHQSGADRPLLTARSIIAPKSRGSLPTRGSPIFSPGICTKRMLRNTPLRRGTGFWIWKRAPSLPMALRSAPQR